MAIEQLYSNILLLNNIDTTALEEKIIVKFAKTDNNPGELFDSPSDIEIQEGEQIYVGIYIGADTDEPIWQDYTWRLYNYEKSHINNVVHIDIRYGFLENDIYKFTEEKDSEGKLIPTGKSKENATYKGVFVTQDPLVMEENWYPGFNNNITAKNYFWTRYIPKEKNSFFYKVKLYKNGNKNEEIINIYKFFEDDTSKYYPPEIYYELIQISNGIEQVVSESNCSYQLVYKIINSEGNEELSITEELTPINGVIQLSTQTDENENKDGIQASIEEAVDNQQTETSYKEAIQIIFNFSKNNQIFYTETKEINYRAEESIARLAVNANDIVASIANAKLQFSGDGLRIKNGGFEILNDKNDRVFYSNNGNLELSGTIKANSGNIGTWFIDDTGLVAKEENGEELAGLYGSNAKASINDSPVLIWAGKKKDDNNNISYKFAVTADGYAQVSGSIIASSGRIQNDFFVGDDNGIIISGGNENSQSYISTSNFASGSLGYGWKLSQDGSAEFSNITARGKIQSSVFEHNKINSVGGSLYIAPTIYIEDVSDELIESKNNDTFEYTVTWNKLPYSVNALENGYQLNVNGTVWGENDILKIDGIVINKIIKENAAIPTVENEEGTEGTTEENEQEKDNSNYEWTTNLTDIEAKIYDIQPAGDNGSLNFGKLTIKFTYDMKDPYPNEEGIRIRNFLSGAILLWQGGENAKRGLYLTATDSGGPFIDVYDYNNNIPKVRIGSLSGVKDDVFANSFSDYGLYASNAYLRGQLILPGAGITNQNTETYGVGGNSSPIRIWAGTNSADMKNANFIVTENGYMYAKQGIFEGTVIATNSEFSGTIKAAGIVIDEGSKGDIYYSDQNHFFVATSDNPASFNDYVLDIGSHGLSIWEGGLRAYSDRAGEIKNSIYGYFEDFLEPLPFFFLVDEADEANPNNKILNSRMVAHKAHFLQIEENFELDKGYSINSIILDNGIWLYKGDSTEAKKDIESKIFHGQSGVAGLNLKEEALQIQGKNINLVSLGEVNINSPVKLSNQNENLISFGGHIIKEARIAVLNENQKEEIKSIGFDFIIN